jgi:hypothetical protein
MKPWTKVETELAKVVVDDLRARGWKVYQEVDVRGSTCDIAATMDGIVWAIECKISLGVGVLAQARGWLDSANLVSVAVLPGRSEGRRLAEDMAKFLGVGVLEVHGPGYYDWMFPSWGRGRSRRIGPGCEELEEVKPSRVREVHRPSRRRVVYPWLRKNLRDEQQDYAPAGTADGKRFTAFAATCIALRHVLAGGPLTVAEAIKRLEGRHHYANEASARRSLYQWAKRGLIDGVELISAGKGKPAQLGLAADQDSV